MAYMSAIGNCIFCGVLFSFNPELVPSIRVNAQRKPDPSGTREPVCRACVERGNKIRAERGLEPIAILPGAYEAEEVA